MIRAVAIALVVAGCAMGPPYKQGEQVRPEPDDSVPASNEELELLLKPCPIGQPRFRSTEEAVRLANKRRQYLIDCNKDKARALEILKQARNKNK